MRRSKTWIVVRREFTSTVKRKAWLITTFGMPVFIGLYALLAIIPGLMLARSEAKAGTAKIGIVDLAGIVRLLSSPEDQDDLPEDAKKAMDLGAAKGGAAASFLKSLTSKTEFEAFAGLDSALRALEANRVGAVYVIPDDYVTTGKVIAYRSGDNPLMDNAKGQSAVRRMLVRSLADGKVAPDVLRRVLTPASVETLTRQRDGTYQKQGIETIVKSFGIPIGFAMLLFISLMMNSGFLLQGVSEEKETRVIEIILSSVDARSLLLGKLLGLGAAGLLQLLVWLTMAVAPLTFFFASLAVSPGTVLLCLAYFVLGFLLFGTLMTGSGALGTNLKESQQYAMVWSLGSAIPMMFFPVLLNEPNGTVARVLSYFPLTSPVTMMIRLGSGAVPWWEVAISLALLVAGVALAIRLAARVFRTALLMYGKRPTIPEIFRWLRQAKG